MNLFSNQLRAITLILFYFSLGHGPEIRAELFKLTSEDEIFPEFGVITPKMLRPFRVRCENSFGIVGVGLLNFVEPASKKSSEVNPSISGFTVERQAMSDNRGNDTTSEKTGNKGNDTLWHVFLGLVGGACGGVFYAFFVLSNVTDEPRRKRARQVRKQLP